MVNTIMHTGSTNSLFSFPSYLFLGRDYVFTILDLELYYGQTMQIRGMTFTLEKHEDLSGVSAVWCSDDYLIYATPMFDNVPVPVQIIDVTGKEIGTDGYPAEVESFNRYCKIVKTLATKIMRRQ
jgi:hypothetical protein